MIDAYLASVRRALGRASAERFLLEIHDHLLEATAAGVERGLSPPEAEARAIGLFGSPELVARQYAAELAAAMWEKHVQTLRFVAVALVLLTLYYARFYVAVRQEGSTLVQIGILLAAAAVLALPVPTGPTRGGWFRNWKPVSLQGWAIALMAIGLEVAVFAWADHGAHSASDTLNRAVPTLCLIAAIALRIAHQQDTSRLTRAAD
jgi:hypothetical protein